MDFSGKQATLGLAMIMKNEAVNLAKSLAPVASCFDELVVVDTGSTDQSPELALALGAKVLNFPWINDFSAARNFGLNQANTDFILWLDADNSLSPSGIKELRQHLSPGAELIVWATEVVTPQGDRLWQKRVFPNRPGEIRFEGRVHEQLVHPPHWSAVASGVEILHWGYADKLTTNQKAERNLELLLNSPETRAGDFYWLYQTGRTLTGLRRTEEAVTWLTRAAKATTPNRPLWGHTLILLSRNLTRSGQHEQAEEVARNLVQKEKGYGPGFYYLGCLLYDCGKAEEAGQMLETALILGTGDQVWGANPKTCNFKAAFLLGRIWAQAGRTDSARQAYSLARELEPQNPEAPFALAEMALVKGDDRTALNHLEKTLTLAPGHRRAQNLYQKLNGGTVNHVSI